jgi:hypothetical protein
VTKAILAGFLALLGCGYLFLFYACARPRRAKVLDLSKRG